MPGSTIVFPNFSEAHYNLGTILTDVGQLKEAEVSLHKAIELNPNFAEAYHSLAEKNGMTLTQLALAFVNDRPFTTSNIIGATNLSQLKENIKTASINLTDSLLQEINTIHEGNPNPST